MRFRLFVTFMMLFLFVLPLRASGNEEDLLNQSVKALYDLAQSLDRGLLRSLFEKTQGIAIFPGVQRLGLFVGTTRGSGVVFACKEGQGTLFGPAFYTIEGLSLGAQFGVQSQDVILFIMRREGLKALFEGRVILGGGLSISLGPKGRGIGAALDFDSSSVFYVYALSQGVFLGIALEGTKILENGEANRNFWKEEVSPETILSEFRPRGFAAQNLARLIEAFLEGGDKR
ncbi:MAG: lipid-binding SYLF domain-containing protein [Candidatus Caldatribacteriaceae bacterium]